MLILQVQNYRSSFYNKERIGNLRIILTWAIYLIGRTSFLYQTCTQKQLGHHHIITNIFQENWPTIYRKLAM